MRDLAADWKKWSRAERMLALVVAFTLIALPISLLVLSGPRPGI
jgi:hypothetical protein